MDSYLKEIFMETRSLPCKLTDDELDQRRDHVANLLRDHERLDHEKKEVAKNYTERLKKSTEAIRIVATEIRERAEYRDVAVEQATDVRNGWANTIRLDTGEVVSQRQLSPHELQTEIPGMGET